jgi:clan AA aspartic protease
MGTFSHTIEIADLDNRHSRQIDAIVDTGAFYTTLPRAVLEELGVEPLGTRRFQLADGKLVEMDYGQAWVTVEGERVITIVAFGSDEGPMLLGAYTLEGLALAVDPVGERLIPRELYLL